MKELWRILESVRKVRRMSENIHKNCENYNENKDMCLKWFEENVSEHYKVCREYSEFDDNELSRKWSN